MNEKIYDRYFEAERMQNNFRNAIFLRARDRCRALPISDSKRWKYKIIMYGLLYKASLYTINRTLRERRT